MNSDLHRDNAKKFYKKSFDIHGASVKGMSWSNSSEPAHNFRTNKLLEIIDQKLNSKQKISILDVGCGYGYSIPLLVKKIGYENLNYHGIDLLPEFINCAKEKYISEKNITFETIDLESFAKNDNRTFDYIICNGIFTLNHSESQLEWKKIFFNFIKDYFEKANIGISFNIVTTHCNYLDQNQFHFSPSEMISYILNCVTDKVKIDHSYPSGFYEYCCFLYKSNNIIQRKDLI